MDQPSSSRKETRRTKVLKNIGNRSESEELDMELFLDCALYFPSRLSYVRLAQIKSIQDVILRYFSCVYDDCTYELLSEETTLAANSSFQKSSTTTTTEPTRPTTKPEGTSSKVTIYGQNLFSFGIN